MNRSSLWTRIHLTSIDKTHTFIQCSRSSPLDLYLKGDKAIDDAFTLIIPHIGRVRSLTINGKTLPTALEHFHCNTPLLEKLDIEVTVDGGARLDGALFNGDLSSLRELRLCGVETRLSQTNLPNLRVLKLELCGSYKTTELLDFFESAPPLHTVSLDFLEMCLSDTPSGRIVRLPHLKDFTFNAFHQGSALLPHLGIPKGASFIIPGFSFRGEASQLLSRLPQNLPGFDNLLDITAMHLSFGSAEAFMRLSGPSGILYASTSWEDRIYSWVNHKFLYVGDKAILESLSDPVLSRIQRLEVSYYWASARLDTFFFQKLSSANDLRTLVLIRSGNNYSFIRTLDPTQHRSGLVSCPQMEELVFVGDDWIWPMYDDALIKMLNNRASSLGGTAQGISSITWVDRSGELSRQGKLSPKLFKAMRDIGVEGRVRDSLPNNSQ